MPFYYCKSSLFVIFKIYWDTVGYMNVLLYLKTAYSHNPVPRTDVTVNLRKSILITFAFFTTFNLDSCPLQIPTYGGILDFFLSVYFWVWQPLSLLSTRIFPYRTFFKIYYNSVTCTRVPCPFSPMLLKVAVVCLYVYAPKIIGPFGTIIYTQNSLISCGRFMPNIRVFRGGPVPFSNIRKYTISPSLSTLVASPSQLKWWLYDRSYRIKK